jgi:hypothetical protein
MRGQDRDLAMRIHSSIARRRGQSREGSAVVIMLVLLAIMLGLAAANTATLNRLRERVKIVDHHQTQRWASCSTNALRAAAPATQPPNSK